MKVDKDEQIFQMRKRINYLEGYIDGLKYYMRGGRDE